MLPALSPFSVLSVPIMIFLFFMVVLSIPGAVSMFTLHAFAPAVLLLVLVLMLTLMFLTFS